jgi:hypothetical protein
MTRTSAVTFSQKIRPFSEQFNRDMRDVISDLQEVTQYLQPLQHLIKKADISGEGGGTAAFPAAITSSTLTKGVYRVKEVLKLPDPEHVGAESREGYAVNIAEISGGPVQNPEWIGTGLSSECADGLIALGARISVETILFDIVTCFEYEPAFAGDLPDEEDGNVMRVPLGTEEEPAFFFHHILPICVSCPTSGDNGDDDDDDDDGNDGEFPRRGSGMRGGYS